MKPYYEEAGIQIFHGDCREILPTLPLVDLVLTDPPYGIGYSPGGGGRGFAPKTFTGKDLIVGDSEPFDPSHLLAFRVQILFGANHYANRLPGSSSWICWDKRENAAPNDFADCELIWTNLGGPARMFRHYWSGCLTESERGFTRLHPTQKPEALMGYLIKRAGQVKGLVDPYMGSGTTLVAAKRAGVHATGIEIEERYCEIAANRLRQSVLDFGLVNKSDEFMAQMGAEDAIKEECLELFEGMKDS